MSDNSLIEWCTATWNFLIGCTKKSAGCMHCYAIRKSAGVAPLGCAGSWEARGFERVSLHVPGMLELGEHYTFLVRKDRAMQCPGLRR